MIQSKEIFFSRSRYFFYLLVFLLSMLSLLFIAGNETTVQSLSSYHPFWLNVFFINYTFIGDGYFVLALIAFFFFYLKKKEKALLLMFGFLMTALFVQLIKNEFNVADFTIFYESGQYRYFTSKAAWSDTHNFPSAHTAFAFMISTILVLSKKKNNLQMPIIIASTLVGFSRIYLVHQGIIDVVSGALIGTFSAIFVYFIAVKRPGFINWFMKYIRFYSGQEELVKNTLAT